MYCPGQIPGCLRDTLGTPPVESRTRNRTHYDHMAAIAQTRACQSTECTNPHERWAFVTVPDGCVCQRKKYKWYEFVSYFVIIKISGLKVMRQVGLFNLRCMLCSVKWAALRYKWRSRRNVSGSGCGLYKVQRVPFSSGNLPDSISRFVGYRVIVDKAYTGTRRRRRRRKRRRRCTTNFVSLAKLYLETVSKILLSDT